MIITSRKRLPWAEAPPWANVLLVHKRDPAEFVFAESYSSRARAFPVHGGDRYDTFRLIPDCWKVVEHRPTTTEKVYTVGGTGFIMCEEGKPITLEGTYDAGDNMRSDLSRRIVGLYEEAE